VAILIQTTLPEGGIPYDQAAVDAAEAEEEHSTLGKKKRELDRSIFGFCVGSIREWPNIPF